jgi:hypothetical protein
MKTFAMAMALATVFTVALMASGTAHAQVVVTYMPVAPAPVAAYYAPAPVVTTAYYAPAPYYVASPVSYYAAAPVVAPMAAPYYVASPLVPAGPYYYGRRVIVRPKVYVVGQPVRNVLRAVTP